MRRLTVGRRYGTNFVAGVVHGDEVRRRFRIAFELLTKRQDVRVDCSRGRIESVSPHVAEQLIARDDALQVLRNGFQQFEFLRRQRHGPILAHHLHAVRSRPRRHQNRAVRRRDCSGASGRPRRTRDEFARTERFGDVVIGAEFGAAARDLPRRPNR